jgi:SAM-dependent methyltransferase
VRPVAYLRRFLAVSVSERNRDVYRDASVVEEYAGDGWLCRGEMRSFRELAERARGQRLLDIGVGSGRTTAVLALITGDYTGIDFSPEMVERASQRHPYARFQTGDARTLSDFRDGEFGAVVFSFNGIDTLGHDDRRAAFEQMHRVLAPGGTLAYSTANRDGPEYRLRPWSNLRPPRTLREQIRYPIRLRYALRSLPNWLRMRRLAEDHGEWALGTIGAHLGRLLVHYVSVPEARRELEAAGFELLSMMDADGVELDPARRHEDVYGMFIVASKR